MCAGLAGAGSARAASRWARSSGVRAASREAVAEALASAMPCSARATAAEALALVLAPASALTSFSEQAATPRASTHAIANPAAHRRPRRGPGQVTRNACAGLLGRSGPPVGAIRSLGSSTRPRLGRA